MPAPAGDPQAKERELAAEQRHVDRAYVRLETMRDEAQALLRQGYRQAQVGTRAALVERDVMVYRAELWARSLDAADDGLVFGRLDHLDQEIRHIGRIGIRDDDSEVLVVDWRAPAAEAFYRATPEDPRSVVRRRVLHCRGRDVIDIEDDLLDPEAAGDMVVVGDGAFLAALSRTRDGSMHDIVATIQREQDEAIRAPIDGSVLVRGGPGTGKTAVALHRVAYLMFQYRQRFGSRGVLIVGPNPRFTAYIERVLPSLGEGGAVLRSLGDLVDGVEAHYHDDAASARLKGAGSMTHLLRRAVDEVPAGAPTEFTVSHRGTRVTLDGKALRRIRRDILARNRRGPNTARVQVARQLLTELWGRLLSRGASRSEKDSFHEDVAGREEFAAFLRAWWPLQRPVDVLAGLSDPERVRRCERDLTPDQVKVLAATWARTARTGEVSFHDVALMDELTGLLGPLPRKYKPSPGTPDDDNPYVVDGLDIFTGEVSGRDVPDEISEVTTYADRMATRGTRRPRDEDSDEPVEYAHIVIDEAQDLTPMQWRMLGRRGRHATWTIVEDPAQSAWEDPNASAAAMAEALRERRRYEFELTTNYRNPVEVADVAARVLVRAVPGARPARAVRTGGERPTVHATAGEPLGVAVDKFVRELLTVVEGTIGVITPVGAAVALAGELVGLDARVQVMDALDAKGLEFDAAVIVDPRGIVDQSPNGMRTLYVALTRATRLLGVVTADPEWTAELLGITPE